MTVYQEDLGNVLDLSPRSVLQGQGPSVNKDRGTLASGSKQPLQATWSLEIPILDSEVLDLARMMVEGGQMYNHEAGFVGLSGPDETHLVWAEKCLLDVQPSSVGFRDVADHSLLLETDVVQASIAQSPNLLAPLPWRGASTPGSVGQADGLTTLAGGEVAVYDDNLQEIFLHESWDGPTFRRFSTPEAFGSEAGMTSFVRNGTEEILITEPSTDAVIRLDLQGNKLGEFLLGSAGGSSVIPDGLTVANGDLVAIDSADELHVYSGVPASGSTDASTTSSVSSESGVTITYDAQSGDLLSVQDDAGTHKLRRHDGVGATITDTTALSTVGITAYSGRLYALNSPELDDYGELGTSGLPTSSVSSVTLSRRMPLRHRGADGRPSRGYFGPTWTAGHEVRVNARGIPDTVSSSKPIIGHLVAPLGTAELELQNVTGALDGLAFNGTALSLNDSSRIGNPPRLLLEGGKYSGLGINADGIWSVHSRIEDVAADPQLVVVQVGTPRGALAGATGPDRANQLLWTGANVEAIAFDVEVDDGDQIEVTVTEATGIDHVEGMISGDGQSDKSAGTAGDTETFGFTYSVDNPPQTYTAEVVAEALEGLTKLVLGNGNEAGPDWSTIKGVDKLSDLRVLEINFKYQNSNGNSDTNMTGSPPAGWLPNSDMTKFLVDSDFQFDSQITTRFQLSEFQSQAPHTWICVGLTKGTVDELWKGLQYFIYDGSSDFTGDTQNAGIGGFKSGSTPEVQSLRQIQADAATSSTWHTDHLQYQDLRKVQLQRSGLQGSVKTLFQEQPDLKVLYNADNLTGDPRNVTWASDPMPLEYVLATPLPSWDRGFDRDAWGRMANLGTFLVRHLNLDDTATDRGANPDDPSTWSTDGGTPGSGGTLSDSMRAHWLERDAGNVTYPSSQILGVRQFVEGSNEYGGPNGERNQRTTLDVDAIKRILGLDTYAADGTIDYISEVKHDSLQTHPVVAADSTSITIECPIQKADRTIVYVVKNSRYQTRVGVNGVNEQYIPVFQETYRDGTTQHLRIDTPDLSTHRGDFTVNGTPSAVDNADGTADVTIPLGSDPTAAGVDAQSDGSGDVIHYGINWEV